MFEILVMYDDKHSRQIKKIVVERGQPCLKPFSILTGPDKMPIIDNDTINVSIKQFHPPDKFLIPKFIF